MDARSLFADHLDAVRGHLEQALHTAHDGGASYDRILFHAGSEQMYHADAMMHGSASATSLLRSAACHTSRAWPRCRDLIT